MKPILLLLCLLILSSCGIQKAKKINSYIAKEDLKVNLGSQKRFMKITYTGCGGFLIQDDVSAIMIDPYFSNHSPMLAVYVKKLKSNTTAIDSFFKSNFTTKKDKEGKIKAILVAHSHYDHLADVPAIYSRNCNQDSTRIIGSKTTQHILRGAGISSIDSISIDENLDIKWISTKSGQIRITPIPSEHAPHIWGHKLLCDKKVTEDFDAFPKKILKLPEGQNYNFLIDFLNEQGKIIFRIFSNAGSSCNAEVGYPSIKLLGGRGVDVLLLCAANFEQVNGYPDGIIKRTNPKHIIINHWENFFRPIKKLQNKAATVPATNVKKFISNLENTIPCLTNFTLPLPLTEIIFSY